MYKPEEVTVQDIQPKRVYKAKDGTTHETQWGCFLHDYKTPENKDIYNAKLLQRVVKDNMYLNTIYVFHINNVEEFYIMLANFLYYPNRQDLFSGTKLYNQNETEYLIIYDDNGDYTNIVFQEKTEYLKELQEEIDEYKALYNKVLGENKDE